jgi:hypothetical protein
VTEPVESKDKYLPIAVGIEAQATKEGKAMVAGRSRIPCRVLCLSCLGLKLRTALVLKRQEPDAGTCRVGTHSPIQRHDYQRKEPAASA